MYISNLKLIRSFFSPLPQIMLANNIEANVAWKEVRHLFNFIKAIVAFTRAVLGCKNRILCFSYAADMCLILDSKGSRRQAADCC